MLPEPIEYHMVYGGRMNPNYAPKFYDYVIAQNGVFKLAKTPHFTASLPIADHCHIAGLKRFDLPMVDLLVPRIPAKLLLTVLNHARNAGGEIEQMYHFHHTPIGWRVSVPKQIASAGSVRYLGGNSPDIVLDLHSHHRMDAFFSATDTADEQGCRFYAVIGTIFSRPTISLRLGVYGDFIRLPAEVLFEHSGPFADTWRAGW